MTRAINEKIVAALPVPAKGNRRYYFSGAVLSGKVTPSGFNVCVTANGVVSFALYHRPHQETLGRWDKSSGGGDLTLIAGIIRAKERAAELAHGADPRPDKTKRQQKGAAIAGVETVNNVLDLYLARMAKDKKDFRSLPQVKNNFDRLVRPAIGNIPAGQLRRKHVIDMLDKITDECTVKMADQVLANFRSAWTWACIRDDELTMPIVKGMRRTTQAEHARSRVLDDDEIRAVWMATADGAPFSRYVRFLLLTAARRSEAQLPWPELDLTKAIWTLPARRNKTKVELARPLSKLALSQLVMNGEPSAFDFTNGKVTRLHRALLERSITAGWTLHDLRRTARTLLSRANVRSEHAERCLGHIIGGVEGTYDRHKYIDEMRGAYETLATLIQQIFEPRENFVALRG
jgi:integrase